MIKVGDTLPPIILRRLKDSVVEEVNLQERVKDKKIILFAVPGAFTPTCSNIHLPSFVKQADSLKAKGIEEIFCVAVNDPYVLDVWEKAAYAAGKVTLLSDGDGSFTKAIGLQFEGSPALGLRSKRYVMVVEDDVVKQLLIEPSSGSCTITRADHIVDVV